MAQSFETSVRSFMRFRPFVLALALPLVLVLISGHTVAQATPGISIGQTFNGETATPIPGGHDYIHLLSETVNESNGSLAFNIQLPIPKGRGVALPYTVMYNSAGLYHLGQNSSGVLTFVPTDLKASSLPWASWSESSYVPVQVTCPPGCNPPIFSQCNIANGFTFNDPTGTSHNLAIGVGATSAKVSEPPNASPCPISGPGAVVPTGSGTGDGKVWAQFTSSGASGLSVTAVQNWSVSAGSNTYVNGPVGPFTVTDENGTTYFFDGNGTYDSTNQLNWEPPYQMEDRNGNIITFGANGFTDTLGRPLIQSGSGGVNIGGLLYPTPTCVGSCSSAAVNYSVPYKLGWNGMSYYPGDTSVACPTSTAIMSVNTSQNGWGGFALPTSTSSNPQQYNFYYGGTTNGGTANSYGLLNEVIYPDGGWVKYIWQMSTSASVSISGTGSYTEMGAFQGEGQTSPGVYSGNPYPSACLMYYATPVLASRVVSYDGVNIAQTQTFQYQTTWGNGQTTWDWTAKQTYVTTTDNITGASYLTVYNYGPSGTPSGTTPFSVGGVAAEIPVETSVLSYSGTSTSSTLLRTVSKSWFDMYHLAEEDTTENGLTSKTVNSYQAPSPTSPFTLLTAKSEYDFGASTPTRTTKINYKTFSPNTITNQSNSVTIPVPSQPSSVIVTNSAGTSLAETDYGYDSYGSGLTSVTAVQHDGTNYGAGMTNRGNLTSMTKQCFNCTSATTTYMFDLTGQPASMTDPNLNKTTYSFTDSPSGGNAAGNSNAYLTQVIYPQTGSTVHQEFFQYNYTFGDLTQSTDENSQITTYQYVDPFDRLTASVFPDNGETKLSYNDSPTSPSVATCQLITGSASAACKATSPPTGWKVSNSLMDGMFHTKQTQLVSDPDGEDYVDISFDGLGRKRTVSNPHRSSASSTDGTSTTTTDALGRPTLLQEQDGSTIQTFYDQTCLATSSTLGTLTIDEAGTERVSCTDGLGRLVEVDEPGIGAHLAPTAATGTITVSGNEQVGQPTPGNGTVTIGGSEPSNPVYPCGNDNCPVYDSGGVSVSINNGPSYGYSFGQNDTEGTIASGLASIINKNSTLVTAQASGNAVQLTSIAKGSQTNYPFSVSLTENTTLFPPPQGFTATASGPNFTQGSNGATDTGFVSVIVDGFQASYTYGASDTPATIASALASQLNSSSSPVTVTLSSNGQPPPNQVYYINVTSKATGSISNYYISTQVTDYSGFSPASFSLSGPSALSGGTDPSPFGSTPFVTLYNYDPLGNLTCVEQHGGVSGTGCSSPQTDDPTSPWRVRRFTYDSLSRLVTAQNPETGFVAGIISYAYDPNSNVVSKTALSPNQGPTGTATVTTSYTYDALNRLTKKSYADSYSNNSGYTPAVVYGYDGVAPIGCTPPALTDTYPIGRRTSMCDGSGETSWLHDAMGRVLKERRTIGGAAGLYVIYAYNKDGSLRTLQTPPQKVINYSVLGAGRPVSAIDSTDTINFVTSATYAPPGKLQSLTNGTAIYGALAYNSRLQPMQLFYSTNTPPAITSMTAACPSTVGNIMNKTYNFGLGSGDNGNVLSISNCRDATRTQSFTYDVLNRITSAQSSGTQWGETFTIDAWGNLTNETGISGKTYSEGLNAAPATNRNQLTGYSYDASGNMINNGGYVYDDENRLIWTAGYRYIYDADGNRVAKCVAATATTACPTSGTNGTLYWRTTSGETLDESDLAGNPEEEYIFFNGERIARRDVTSTGATVAVHYYFSDHLGTHAVVSNAAGTTLEQDIDYYPFGGQQNDYSTASVPQHYKFNGKERDGESGLDNFGARFDASSLGRFMTPDWAAKPTAVPYALFGNPQSLNLYSYVNNNPTTTRDPDGHCLEDACVIEGAVVVTAMAVAYLSSPPGQQLLHNAVNSLTGLFHSSNNSNTAPAPQSNPAPGTQAPKDVYIDPNKYPASAGHAADAQAAGKPDVLTVDRPGKSDNRADAMAGHPAQPGTDRDEYPPAVTREGGAGASVRNIDPSDNRGAGASLGNQIRDVPNGGQIRVIPQPPPPPPPKPEPQSN